MSTPSLGLVVPCFNEQEILPKTINQLSTYLESLVQSKVINEKSFVLFIDDGSVDCTWQIISEEQKRNAYIEGLKLSKNFGHQNALLSGLLSCKNKVDCIISIDADLQQDKRAIKDFIAEYNSGFDIVCGVRNNRKTDSSLKRITAEFFYTLMKLMGVNLLRNHADYRLMSNKAICALSQYDEGNLFLRGIVPTIGFKQSTINFDVKEREAGESKYTPMKMLSFALSGITSFSIAPLRLVSALGLLFTLISLLMLLYVLIAKFFFNDVLSGWASIVIPIYLLGGIQLLGIGIIGEYVGRTYIESKGRPRFIIEENTLD